jgi:hypothetical protein
MIRVIAKKARMLGPHLALRSACLGVLLAAAPVFADAGPPDAGVVSSNKPVATRADEGVRSTIWAALEATDVPEFLAVPFSPVHASYSESGCLPPEPEKKSLRSGSITCALRADAGSDFQALLIEKLKARGWIPVDGSRELSHWEPWASSAQGETYWEARDPNSALYRRISARKAPDGVLFISVWLSEAPRKLERLVPEAQAPLRGEQEASTASSLSASQADAGTLPAKPSFVLPWQKEQTSEQRVPPEELASKMSALEKMLENGEISAREYEVALERLRLRHSTMK